MKVKNIKVLLGMHGSGKTMIGNYLHFLGFSYFNEIGTDLRKRCGCNVLDSCFLFDREIMVSEAERDSILLRKRKPVIESWHIGNIAFARARNNESVVDNYINLLERRLKIFRPLAVIIEISDNIFMKRSTECNIDNKNVLLAFYKCVFSETMAIISEYNMQSVSIDGNKDIYDVQKQVIEYLEEK